MVYGKYFARVELVKLSEMLEKAYILRHSEFGGCFYARDPRHSVYDNTYLHVCKIRAL